MVFTSVVHHRDGNGVLAHGGFAREIALWAGLFREVVVVSPQSGSVPEADAVRYHAANVRFLSLGNPAATTGVSGKFRLLFRAPGWVKRCRDVIRDDDVIMGRGPDSVGFLGYLLSRRRANIRFAKFADQWEPFAGEPLGYRIQKWVYRSARFGGPVLIYGDPDPRRPHLVPFLPSAVSRKEWDAAGTRIGARVFDPPLRLLFAGRLVPAKGADVLLQALALLSSRGTTATVDIAGDGPERRRLEALASELGVSGLVHFHGRLGWEDLASRYASAHCFVHCSRKEGFGKVLLEAMTYGLPVVATDVGVSASLLRPPEAGWVIPPDSPELLADTLSRLQGEAAILLDTGRRARERVVPFLIENQEARYRAFLESELGLSSR